MNSNPFSLTFGKEPFVSVPRAIQLEEVTSTFLSERPATQAYILTGVRGSGKTVAMTKICKAIQNNQEWIVVLVNPNKDILQNIVSNLYEDVRLKSLFLKASINFNPFGIGANITTNTPMQDCEVILRKMLKEIKHLGKKVLLAIDEATNTGYMKVFASAFQNYIREELPVYLLMTGLFEKIRNLQNEDTLTFLYRTPRIEMKPLGMSAMVASYKKILEIDDEEATLCAKFTKGYSYAFQVLGYLLFKKRPERKLEAVIPEFDVYMEEYVYEKIWAELSAKDREVIRYLSINGKSRVKDIQEATNTTSSSFSTYRRRLGQTGLIDTSEYGYCDLLLPRFGEIVKYW